MITSSCAGSLSGALPGLAGCRAARRLRSERLWNRISAAPKSGSGPVATEVPIRRVRLRTASQASANLQSDAAGSAVPNAIDPRTASSDAGVESTRASVSAVLVNWNTRDLLAACLETLRPGLHPRLARVIVVDNASRDGSAAMVHEKFPWAEVIEPGRNTGYAAGNNLGLQAVNEPYVLLLNPDTEVYEGVVEALAHFMDFHPSCAVVAPQLVSPDGRVQRSCRGFPTPASLLPELLGVSRLIIAGQSSRFLRSGFAECLGRYRLAGWDHDTERRVDQPMGSALLVRHSAIQRVGLMDEQFPLFFNEVDWLYRMKEAGWETWFTPAARVLHHLGASTRQVRVKAAWLSHTGLHTFYQKHYRSRLNPALYGIIVAAIYGHGILVVLGRIPQQWWRRLLGLRPVPRKASP